MKIPVTKNEVYTVQITDMLSSGEGVAKIDGFAVFVPDTLVAETVKIKIVKVKKSYAYAKAVEILQTAENRIEPVCPVSEKCGGCSLLHMDYQSQLCLKRNIVVNALKRIGGLDNVCVEPVIGMKTDDGVPCRYRNKMVFPVGKDKSGNTVMGFYRPRSHDIVETDDCYLGNKTDIELSKTVVEYMKIKNIKPYSEQTHSGIVRRVFIRHSKKTKEIMVVVSCNARKLPDADLLVDMLKKTSDNVSCVILNVNTDKNNLVLGDKNIVLWGDSVLHDSLCGVDFKISANSFYQVNPVQTEILYQTAVNYAGLDKNKTVVDLYCGIGTISLCMADKCKKVFGIEIVEDAVINAKSNAELNGIENAEFYAGAVEKVLPELLKGIDCVDVVVLDPPRKGSDETTLTAIVNVNPERIVYVSCDPSTLARDVKFLTERGYDVDKVQPVDMFPNTPHVETVVLLSQRKPDDRVRVKIDLDDYDLTKSESKATYDEIKEYVFKHSDLKVSSLNIAQVKQKYGIIERENYNKAKSADAKQPQCTKDKEKAIVDALRHFKMI